MSKESNNQGRAYEYICLITLEREIKKIRPAEIEINSSYQAALSACESIDEDLRNTLKDSAVAVVESIFELEPLIVEDGTDMLTLSIQTDGKGEEGDVRDILIVRRNIHWEIGLSIKHNHFAVKHSRLAKGLDFGQKWFGVKCSDDYWKAISPIFTYLEEEKVKHTKWRELPSKESDVYIPLLTAFMGELKRSYKEHTDIPAKLVEYLLGKFDFYKVISIDKKRTTQIQTFNLRGTLNKASKKEKPKTIVPISNLPTRIVNLEMKPDSSNTVELYMDNGWQFGFRIHNAETNVIPSLKLDIQIIGMPATIVSINCLWK